MNKSKLLPRVKTLVPLIGGLLCGAVALGVVVYYIVGPARGYFHSDCADTIFWAQASLDAGTLYNTEFGYACLLPFGGELLMLPWVALFGVSYIAHAIGMLIFLGLFTAALVWLCRMFRFGWGYTGLTVALVLGTLCVSEKLREIYFGHIIYYSLGSLFLAVGIALLLQAEKMHKRWWLGTALVCVWFFLCALNGLPSLALFAIPALLGYAGERWLDMEHALWDKKNRRVLTQSLFALGATLAGTAEGAIIGRNITAGYENAFSTLSPMTEWQEHIDVFLVQWLTLLGVDVNGFEAMASLEGIGQMLLIAVGLLLLLVPLIALPFWKKLSRASRILLLAHGGNTAFILFAFVFGALAGANWRLSPLVVTAVLLTVSLAHDLCDGMGVRLGVPLLLAVSAFATLGLGKVVATPADYGQDTGVYEIATYLEEQGYTYGYATFWNAGAVTVLSDSAVRVRNLSLDNGTITAYPYQSQRSWFTDQGDGERYFLLLTEQEFGELLSAGSDIVQNGGEEHGNYVIIPLERSLF